MLIADGVTDEMVKRTEDKFLAWDNVVASNILETGTQKQKDEAYKMLNDPTLYFYAFFKSPWDRTKKFKLYPYQDMIINDKHDRIFFAAANQIGKSVCLCCDSIHYALLNPGHTVLMVSKTLPQSKDLLRQIKSILQSSSLDYSYDIGDSATKTEVYFKHYEEVEVTNSKGEIEIEKIQLQQSRIICVPATEAALGYAVHKAEVDEICFYDNGEYFYNQILVPRTYTTKGSITAFSNPNGQQGIGWDLWNNPDYHQYRFAFLDCQTNTQEELEKHSRGKTQEQIDSTLLARFTSPEGGFLTTKEREDMQEDRSSFIPTFLTNQLYIFFDWAKTGDRTVRVIGSPIHKSDDDWADEVFVHEMVEYDKGTTYTKIVDEDLKALIKNVGADKIAMVGWDNTGVGKGIEDFVKRVEQLGIMAMPVEFSLQNKSRIYTLFKLLAEQRRIKIPKITECNKQLSTLRFQKSSRGYMMVHHDNERDRDDYPDALAGLCSLMIAPDNAPVTCEII